MTIVGNKFSRSANFFLISQLLFSIYLGISVVYWVPAVSIEVMALVKFGLVAAAVMSTYFVALVTGTFALPRGMMGPAGFFLLLVASLAGLLQADISTASDKVLDLILSFTFLWCFFILVRVGANIDRIVKGAVLIIAVFCVLTISSSVTGTPNWSSPYDLLDPSLSAAGFGAKRTGWSGGLALFFALAVLFLRTDHKTKMRRFLSFLLFIVIAASILGSQIVSGGRAGIIASLATIILFLILSPSRLKVPIIVVIAITVSAGFVLQEFLVEQLRVYRLIGSTISASSIDTFSSGRMSGYEVAIRLIREKPFTGHGFGQISLFNFGIKYNEVHNLWLKLAMEGGVLLPIALISVVGALLSKMRYVLRGKNLEERKRIVVMAIVVVSGLVISLFEPNMLLGTFQNSAIWWAAAGILLGQRPPDKNRNVKRKPMKRAAYA